ncbi:hypothetical protein KEM56_006110 [Ascosphaera pollenicola]|nr:hypothetical protein KEM56_006110 [Ascosphaera pollenicola]
MWVLSSDGDLFKGIAVIDNPSVTREHLLLEVLPVKADYYSRTTRKTRVLITDKRSKCGTFLDRQLVPKGETVELQGNGPFMLQIGKYPDLFTIQWVDVVLSLNVDSVLSNSSTKGRFIESDPQFIGLRDKVAPADIKLIREFISEVTTHVVQTRRVTDWTIPALLKCKRIVNPSFIDALAHAITPADVNDPNSRCPLEKDFDGSFPLADEYPPERKTGQNDIPDKALFPDHRRRNMFEGYTFIFTEETQFLRLLSAITTGHGKALLYEINEGHVTGREVFDYMQSIAQKKKMKLDQYSKIALVELDKSDHETANWAERVETEVMQLSRLQPVKLDLFLQAVIKCDPSMLIQTVQPEQVEETPEPDVIAAERPPSLLSDRGNDQIEETAIPRRIKRPLDIQSESMPPPEKPQRLPTRQSQLQSQSQSQIQSQPQADLERSTSVPLPPSKRPRVREYTGRVDTFALDDDEDFAPPPSDDDDGEALLDEIPESPIADRDDVIASTPLPSAAAPVPQEEDTSMLEEGVTALLPGAEAMKTHAITERQRHGRRSPSVASQQSLQDQQQNGETVPETPPKEKTAPTKIITNKRTLAVSPTKSQKQSSAASPRRSKRQKTTASNPEDEEMIRAARQLREEQDREFDARRREEETPFQRALSALPLQQKHEQERKQPRNDPQGPPLQPNEEELGITLEEIQRLVIVEEMDVPAHHAPRQNASEDNEQWNPRWNGRPNFKKFRRAKRTGGQSQSADDELGNGYRGVERPKIPVVEVKTTTFIPGEVHWDEERIGQPRVRGADAERPRVHAQDNEDEEMEEDAGFVDDSSTTYRDGIENGSMNSRRAASVRSGTQATLAGSGWTGSRTSAPTSRAAGAGSAVDDEEEEEASFRW